MAEDKKKEIDVTVIEVTEEYLKEKLYKIRGKRVLLDADLAEIYGYDTKGFNRQVKNNIEKSKGGWARMMNSNVPKEKIDLQRLEKYLGKRGWNDPSEWM